MGTPAKQIVFRILFLLGWCLVISSCRVRNGTTYYVATNGNDFNSGSQSQPWKTIQKAAVTMMAGDTVLIHAGTYYEKILPYNSGTDGKYITYQNFGDGDVVIDALGDQSACIEVYNKAYLRFIGLHLRNAGYSNLNAAFAAYSGANHLVLDHIIAETSRFGIMLKGNNTASEDSDKKVSFVTIKNSTVRNNSAYGIFLYYKVTDSVIGPNNIIYNENDKNGVPLDDQYGIDLDTNYPGDPANGARRITIIGNEIYGNRIQGIRPWNAQDVLIKGNYLHQNGATGIQIETGCANVIVDGNWSEFNTQGYEYEAGIWVHDTVNVLVQNNVLRGNQIGLMVTSTKRALVRNNLVYDNNRAATGSNIMGAVINLNSTDITFVHNTLWRNGSSESRGNLAYCMKPPVMKTVIKNNIFSESLGVYDGWVNCSVTSDFNDFSNTRPINMNWLGIDFAWSDYTKNSGQDIHSISTDPLFVNPTGGDFSLSDQSPAINSGSTLAHTTAAGSGKYISVDDARYFTDGIGLISGDKIRVGAETVKVVGVDYISNTITVDRQIHWDTGDTVSYAYSGMRPDMGAKESGGVDAIPSAPPKPGDFPDGD